MLAASSRTDGPIVSLPPVLRSFAERSVGAVHEAVDCSWPREASRVWRITAGRSRSIWYLKQHPSQTFHAREVNAYARWAPALGPGCVPEVRAADPGLRAVILTALPGTQPYEQDLTLDDEREVQRGLGRVLHDLHHAQAQRPPEPSVAQLAKVRRQLTAVGTRITAGEGVLAGRMAVRLASLPPLPLVPTHGDVQLRNILWDPATRTLALIDFERAEYGPAVRDLIRLEYGPWDGRPDLKQAFFDGFGPALTALETRHLHAMAALDAVSGIAYGLEAGDDEVVTRGHRTLRRLLRDPNRH